MSDDVAPGISFAAPRDGGEPEAATAATGSAAPDVAVLAAELLAATTADEVLVRVADRAGSVLGARVVAICLLDPTGQWLRLVTTKNTPDQVRDRYAAFPVDRTTPSGDAVVRREPILLGSRAERVCRYPALATLKGLSEASATLPLFSKNGAVLGAVTFAYAEHQTFSEGQIARLWDVARMSGMALQRAAAFDAEREARRAAETTSRRLRALQRSIADLAEATEPWQVIDAVLTAASATLDASAAALAEYEPAIGTAVVVAAIGPSQGQPVPGVRFPVADFSLAGDLVSSGRPLLVNSRAERDARYPDMIDSGVRQEAWAILPLVVRGEVVGWVSFGWDDPRTFGDEEVGYLTSLAAHTATAHERARLLAQTRGTAEALQRALLPDVAAVPGWDRATLYVPAVAGTEVGGDWFDAFTLRDGLVGVVVGDVAGKGIRAATVMGAARSALRAYAVVDAAPERVLSRMDAYLALYKPDELITCLYGVLDPRTGHFRYANAGHPPPLIVGRDDVRWLEDVLDPPLGTAAVTERDAAGAELGTATAREDGSPVLLLYSDGVVERRHGDLQEGLGALAVAARLLPAADDLQAAVHALCAALEHPDCTGDDRAMIAFRRAVPQGPQ